MNIALEQLVEIGLDKDLQILSLRTQLQNVLARNAHLEEELVDKKVGDDAEPNGKG